jgi:hypothetical protein
MTEWGFFLKNEKEMDGNVGFSAQICKKAFTNGAKSGILKYHVFVF